MNPDDTIAAISSASGPAARMIVRAAGPGAMDILNSLSRSMPPPPAAFRTTLRFAALRVPCWVYSFASPRSYTGDDLIELHIPGNPLLARLLLNELFRLGARPAEPGEFTARAFFRGRIDLSQAEGVAAVVSAGNQAELDAGRRLMNGELSRRLRPSMDHLARTLALVEAEIDFSDQDVRFLAAEEARSVLNQVETELADLMRNSARFARLSHEPRLVLAGRPNAGKSTLLNALSASARAIVSPVAGTTRDALSAPVALDRGIVCLVDVAGLEDHPEAGEIEAAMQRRAQAEVDRADGVILVCDATDDRPPLELSRPPDLIVQTKIDLIKQQRGGEVLAVSAISGLGMDNLLAALDILAFGREGAAQELALTSRHVQAISDARSALARANDAVAGGAELLAAELRQVLDALGQVAGDVSPDDILGRIFSTFCIGK